MKKGDARRQQILETAERLFYQNGYENTSVQVILDEMNLSKGGFYHHFESKMALLEEICVHKAEAAYEEMEQVMYDGSLGAVDKLNALLGRSGLLDQNNVDFLALMLDVAYRGGGAVLRERMKQASMDRALTYMNAILAQGLHEQSFYTQHQEDIGKLIIMLGFNLTDEIAAAMASDGAAQAVIGRVINLLDTYRSAIETLLCAPYGSVTLYSARYIVDMYCKLKGLSAPPDFSLDE